MTLTTDQERLRAEVWTFVDNEIVPRAALADRQEQMPMESIQALSSRGYLGALVPRTYRGMELDPIGFGLLNEGLGRGCSSLRSLLTVQSMMIQAITKWGSTDQKDSWLPGLAAGTKIGAFALTEPNAGSNANEIQTEATRSGSDFLITGDKRWTTFGQMADVFLVFTCSAWGPTAFLVERNRPGLTISPVRGMLGVRASMLAELHFERCRVPKECLVGRLGFGLSHVASFALDIGRYSVAWGCVGIAEACLQACLQYTSSRTQFGKPLREQQLIQRMITRMIAGTEASRLLCLRAGRSKETRSTASIFHTSLAKYFASQTATQIAGDAVQIHGANGCSCDFPVERYLRDAKIMEIIEGSTEIHEMTLAQSAYQDYGLQASMIASGGENATAAGI